MSKLQIRPTKPLPPYRDGVVLKGMDMVEYYNVPYTIVNECRIPKNNLSRADINKMLKPLNNDHEVVLMNKDAKYTFRFKSIENKNEFMKNPMKYIPGTGGFCLWGLAYEWNTSNECYSSCIDCSEDEKNESQCNENGLGWKWTKYVMGPPADVELGWFIYKEKIYFNYASNYRDKAVKDIETSMKIANKRWTDYYDTDIGPLNTRSWGSPNPSWRVNTTLTNIEWNRLVLQQQSINKYIEEAKINLNKTSSIDRINFNNVFTILKSKK